MGKWKFICLGIAYGLVMPSVSHMYAQSTNSVTFAVQGSLGTFDDRSVGEYPLKSYDLGLSLGYFRQNPHSEIQAYLSGGGGLVNPPKKFGFNNKVGYQYFADMGAYYLHTIAREEGKRLQYSYGGAFRMRVNVNQILLFSNSEYNHWSWINIAPMFKLAYPFKIGQHRLKAYFDIAVPVAGVTMRPFYAVPAYEDRLPKVYFSSLDDFFEMRTHIGLRKYNLKGNSYELRYGWDYAQQGGYNPAKSATHSLSFILYWDL